MQMLFYAHSGLRFLVLLLGVLAVAYYGYAIATHKGSEKAARTIGAIFVGTLDLQASIGLVMVILGAFYPALMGHLFMMVAAVVVAHVSMAMARSAPLPDRAMATRLLGVILALLLIAGGIMAIGREIFGSGAPSFS